MVDDKVKSKQVVRERAMSSRAWVVSVSSVFGRVEWCTRAGIGARRWDMAGILYKR